jgi:hypothetical protein
MEVTIDDMLENLKSIRLQEELPNLVNGTSVEITGLIKDQLYHGKSAVGQIIPQYSPTNKYYGKEFPEYRGQLYRDMKATINSLPGIGTPDLFLTGKFYEAMGVKVNGDTYDVESDTDHSERLEERYGDEILALSPENAEIYANGALAEAIKTHITGKTGLLFS